MSENKFLKDDLTSSRSLGRGWVEAAGTAGTCVGCLVKCPGPGLKLSSSPEHLMAGPGEVICLFWGSILCKDKILNEQANPGGFVPFEFESPLFHCESILVSHGVGCTFNHKLI